MDRLLSVSLLGDRTGTAKASISGGGASKNPQEMENVTAVRPRPHLAEPGELRSGRSGVALEDEHTTVGHDAGDLRQIRRDRSGIGRIGEHDFEALAVRDQSPQRMNDRAADDPD